MERRGPATRKPPRRRVNWKMEKTAVSNLTRAASIRVPLERADTLLSRCRGLMFRPTPLAIFFTFPHSGRHSIHSFFVPLPFDAVFLDERMRVSDLFLSIPPFTPLVAPSAPCRYLLELPAGGARTLKARHGDKLRIVWKA